MPSLTELQRANLIRDIMQPMEEVAYGQDIERTVFFPRNTFGGVISNKLTRIGSIDVTHFQIEIAVVDSKQTVRATAGKTDTDTANTGG